VTEEEQRTLTPVRDGLDLIDTVCTCEVFKVVTSETVDGVKVVVVVVVTPASIKVVVVVEMEIKTDTPPRLNPDDVNEVLAKVLLVFGDDILFVVAELLVVEDEDLVGVVVTLKDAETACDVDELKGAVILEAGDNNTLDRVFAIVVGLESTVTWLIVSEEGEEDVPTETAFAEEANTETELAEVEDEVELQEVNISVIQVVVKATGCVFMLMLGGTDS